MPSAPTRNQRQGRACFCGDVYLGHGKCARAHRCPRQYLGQGSWHVALPLLQTMTSDDLEYWYPGLYLPKLTKHVAKMQQKHEARKVARLQNTAATRAFSYDSGAASSWERVGSIGASAGKGAWKGTQ